MSDPNNLKVYISADIEGISGVVAWDETEPGKHDYEYFRKIMTEEVNACVEACFEYGCSEVVVRDAHGNARNILLNELNPNAQLIREWSGGPLWMLEGINEEFDAVLYIGYHAKSGTPNAPLKHTFSGQIYDLKINGISLSEAAWNALIAGYYNIPVIFSAGDQALCEHLKLLIENIGTVPVKKGIGKACLTLHPKEVQKRIRKGTLDALATMGKIKPYSLTPPYKMEINFSDETLAWKMQWYPGASLLDERTVALDSEDFFDCMRFLSFTM